MQAEQLREALDRDPFRPFNLRFGSGKVLKVSNPGLVAISKSGRTTFAFHAQDDGWDIIETMLIEAIEFPPISKNGHRKRK
jgi:hypothetical protein